MFKAKINFGIIFSSIILLSPLSYAASFDCSKASSNVEKRICSNNVLRNLDVVLSSNYKAVIASNIGDSARQDLRNTQRAWIKIRNECSTTKCIEEAYRTRNDVICDDYPVISGMHPGCDYVD